MYIRVYILDKPMILNKVFPSAQLTATLGGVSIKYWKYYAN